MPARVSPSGGGAAASAAANPCCPAPAGAPFPFTAAASVDPGWLIWDVVCPGADAGWAAGVEVGLDAAAAGAGADAGAGLGGVVRGGSTFVDSEDMHPPMMIERSWRRRCGEGGEGVTQRIQ